MLNLGKKLSGKVLLITNLVLAGISVLLQHGALDASPGPGAVMVITINGSINPATDDFLRTSIERAKNEQAQLLIIKLNTPGGLLTSMQSMVARLLESPVPTVVFVSPSGGGAVSAGAFITLAANFAVMAPGTTIGAAHPVATNGQDVSGVMGEKIENFAVSLIRAISEQRGRNGEWAEKAVRESVSITDREALTEKVIDFTAADLDNLLEQLEGKTATVGGRPVSLSGLKDAPLVPLDMSFKQIVVNILSDPNVAILLGLAAMLGLGIELYHPGLILPGVVGAICLVLSLTASQVLPINYGGLALIALGAIFFIVEMAMPTFGVWGVAGIVCFVIGSIYLIDTDMVWSADGFTVNKVLVSGVSAFVVLVLGTISTMVMRDRKRSFSTGREGLLGQRGTVKTKFSGAEGDKYVQGKVQVMGEYWNARAEAAQAEGLVPGARISVIAVEPGMKLMVKISAE